MSETTITFERQGTYANPSRGPEEWPIDEIICDKCGNHIGYCSEFDLNGSYFFCDECVEEENNVVSL